MEALIVYESAWKNTRFVADEICDGLSEHGVIEVVPAHEAPRLADLTVDLLVVGAPTHASGLSWEGAREGVHNDGGEMIPSGVREWLDAGGRARLTVATFDTHVRYPDLPGHASTEIAEKLRKLGCRLIADPETFHVDGHEGPLLPGELERARAWGERLAKRVVG